MSYSQLSIVYVEDDPASRNIMSILLSRVMRCPAVTIWEDSADFLDKVANLPAKPNLFLLDIHVAPIDGFGLLKLLRTIPDYDQAKIIALTASVTTSEVNTLRETGFDGLIGKPIKQASFPTLIDRIIAGAPVWMVS
ncbi:MAG: response regulator [Chloroflexota bacterium]